MYDRRINRQTLGIITVGNSSLVVVASWFRSGCVRGARCCCNPVVAKVLDLAVCVTLFTRNEVSVGRPHKQISPDTSGLHRAQAGKLKPDTFGLLQAQTKQKIRMILGHTLCSSE
jgi:hypothetical protein